MIRWLAHKLGFKRCPECETLVEYAMDGLPESQQGKVRRHLADCPPCREQVRDYWQVREGLGLCAGERDVPDGLCAKVLARLDRGPGPAGGPAEGPRQAGMGRAARIAPDAWRALGAEALARYPHEACGVLLGRAGAAPEVLEAHPAPNVDAQRSRDRYFIDPRRQLDIEKEARRRGLDVVGYFHSHPDHPAQASPTDLERSWEGFLYVIVSVREGRLADCRAWMRPDPGAGFEEVTLEGAGL